MAEELRKLVRARVCCRGLAAVIDAAWWWPTSTCRDEHDHPHDADGVRARGVTVTSAALAYALLVQVRATVTARVDWFRRDAADLADEIARPSTVAHVPWCG